MASKGVVLNMTKTSVVTGIFVCASMMSGSAWANSNCVDLRGWWDCAVAAKPDLVEKDILHLDQRTVSGIEHYIDLTESPSKVTIADGVARADADGAWMAMSCNSTTVSFVSLKADSSGAMTVVEQRAEFTREGNTLRMSMSKHGTSGPLIDAARCTFARP